MTFLLLRCANCIFDKFAMASGRLRKWPEGESEPVICWPSTLPDSAALEHLGQRRQDALSHRVRPSGPQIGVGPGHIGGGVGAASIATPRYALPAYKFLVAQRLLQGGQLEMRADR
jgi:hypothetical protein